MTATMNSKLFSNWFLILLFSSFLLSACGGDDDCDPECDADACEECIDGECVSYCEEGEICDGEGNCVVPVTECDPPCDENACEECVDGECVSYCEGDEVCDGEGNCVAPSEECDPPCDESACEECIDGECVYLCDADACEECVDGECVSYCEGDEICDGEGNCVEPSDDCDPECDENACEVCIDGECVFVCDEDACEECVDGECVLACDSDACEECVDGECVFYCEEGEVCDGEGGCVPAAECDPACDESACEECIDGECVYVCDPDACEECVDGECVYVCDPDACEECVDGECVFACDPDACEECVDGDCVLYCEADEACDGEGNCIAPSDVIGSTCAADEDCGLEDAICLGEFQTGLPGGFCTIDCFAAECPEGTVCLQVGQVHLCAPSCDPAADDCRDGLTCVDLGDGDAACWAGCTDNAHCTATDYCDVDSGFCECPPGYVPDHDTETCEQFDCEAVEVFEEDSITGNTCNEGTQVYTGEQCIGWMSLGYEVVFALDVPANTSVDVEVLGVDYDASLWVTTDCYDFSGAQCVAGADETLEGEPEEVTIINASEDVVTYFIVADTYYEDGMTECGDYELTIGEFVEMEDPFDCEETLLGEHFNAVPQGDLPAGWELDWTEGGETWHVTSDRGGSSLDGTPFLLVDSDAAGMGATLDEAVSTAAVDVTGHNYVILSFEQYFNHMGDSVATVQVYDGDDWQDVLVMTEDHGSWGEPDVQMIDITEHANDELQVRFIYEAGWHWFWAIDNVSICGETEGLPEPDPDPDPEMPGEDVCDISAFLETFDDVTIGELPADWELDSAETGYTWHVSDQANSLNGTPFLFVDSDAAGSGLTLDEAVSTPAVDVTGHDYVFLAFEQYYWHTSSSSATVQVFDGVDWQDVLVMSETRGSWSEPDVQIIDITEHANDELQVRFTYGDGGTWAWWWAIDNVVICGSEDALPIGETEVTLTGGESFGDQFQGSNTAANLMADAIRAHTGADFGTINSTVVQTGESIEPGPFTEDELVAIYVGHIANNHAVVADITGAELEDFLLVRSQVYDNVDVQVSGFSYDILLDADGNAVEVDVRDGDGEPLDADGVYSITFNSYNFDTSYELDDVVENIWETGESEEEMLLDYVGAFDDPIPASLADDRVTIIPDE